VSVSLTSRPTVSVDREEASALVEGIYHAHKDLLYCNSPANDYVSLPGCATHTIVFVQKPF
jgi:hypothetical protein